MLISGRAGTLVKSNKRGVWNKLGWEGMEISIKQKEKGYLETRSNLANDLLEFTIKYKRLNNNNLSKL